MDEILVNFDPHRARATVDTIVELSKEHQVLFFTCHPHMAGLFREIDPQIPVLFREIDPQIPVLEISEQKVKKSME
jgi:hypothetical protein